MSEYRNPFITEVYPDGDVDYNPPQWREQIDNQKANNHKLEHDAEDMVDHTINREEVALKHSITGAVVKLTNDGCIDIFAGNRLGVRLDPKTNSLNFFGDNLNLFGKNVNIRTKPNGFSWNGYSFNPQLYYEDDKERGLQLTGTKEYKDTTSAWKTQSIGIKPMIKSDSRVQYSNDMLSILSELGLPVDNVE